MTQVLIYTRNGNDLLDYGFFSRELSRVDFNYGPREVTLVLMKERHSGDIHLCLVQVEIENLINQNKNHPPSANLRNENQINKQLSLSFISPIKKAILCVDAHIASCVSREIRLSRKFRRRFLKYVGKKVKFLPYLIPEMDRIYGLFDSVLDVSYVVEIKPFYPVQKIDFAWGYRIEGQVTKRILLEDTMSWLSTLGGGYSSLGDYFQFHAEEAGRISVQQLRIAVELGDPIIAAKCRLFFAQSLMQTGQFDKARLIIRIQQKFAKSLVVPDEKLNSMYRALRTRLKYLISLESQNGRL